MEENKIINGTFYTKMGLVNNIKFKLIYGIVSAKRDLVHIIKFVIKMPYV